MKNEALDRLSPLTSGSIPFLTVPDCVTDPREDLEKFVENEMDASTSNQMQQVRRLRFNFEDFG